MTFRSPLRYPGGKARALDQIMPLLPAWFTEFREPFIGGGSVFVHLKATFNQRVNRYWVNDLNPDVAAFWQQIAIDSIALADEVLRLRELYPIGRDLYQSLKHERYSETTFNRAVRFFIMNRITFSGVMDAGGYSEQAFHHRFTMSAIKRVRHLGGQLGQFEVTSGDYEALLTQAGQQVFIFLDPPYYSATKSKLYGKGGELHTAFNHERFATAMRQCTQHRWLITYDDSPYIRDLFSFAEIVEWELQYGMNNYKQVSAAKGKELFIKNY